MSIFERFFRRGGVARPNPRPDEILARLSPPGCYHAYHTTPLWTEDGWRAVCKFCKADGYFGDGDAPTQHASVWRREGYAIGGAIRSAPMGKQIPAIFGELHRKPNGDIVTIVIGPRLPSMTPAERADEILRIVDIYRTGCSNGGGDAYVVSMGRDKPSDCEECTLDFLQRIENVVTGP
jgi:hypothetical protein